MLNAAKMNGSKTDDDLLERFDSPDDCHGGVSADQAKTANASSSSSTSGRMLEQSNIPSSANESTLACSNLATREIAEMPASDLEDVHVDRLKQEHPTSEAAHPSSHDAQDGLVKPTNLEPRCHAGGHAELSHSLQRTTTAAFTRILSNTAHP